MKYQTTTTIKSPFRERRRLPAGTVFDGDSLSESDIVEMLELGVIEPVSELVPIAELATNEPSTNPAEVGAGSNPESSQSTADSTTSQEASKDKTPTPITSKPPTASRVKKTTAKE